LATVAVGASNDFAIRVSIPAGLAGVVLGQQASGKIIIIFASVTLLVSPDDRATDGVVGEQDLAEFLAKHFFAQDWSPVHPSMMYDIASSQEFSWLW
jgi:hypothetical protein